MAAARAVFRRLRQVPGFCGEKMATGITYDVLDLRHFGAPQLRPLLEAEADVWSRRLHWDYRASSRLLMQYLDNHMLPGYAAVDSGQIMGYSFCVYEEDKAVIGDVFAMDVDTATGVTPAKAVERTLLNHMLETLMASPHVDRVESQLLLHPTETHAEAFREAGFEVYRRLFMVQKLEGPWNAPRVTLPAGLEMRPWRDDDLSAAARLIAEAYDGHPDSLINHQYCTPGGSLRFLNNIVRYAGCGVFVPPASHVVVERGTRTMAALVLGSRVSPVSGHITQLCVSSRYRRQGLARMLLGVSAAHFMRQGASEISLTVTEMNHEAVKLYEAEEYEVRHSFDAAVWVRP